MSKTLITIILVQLLSGCMFAGSKENLMEALREYNDGLRWAKVEWMAPHVPKKDRDQFLERRLEDEDLKVTGYDLASVRLKGTDRAVVLVKVDWYHLRQARLHTSVIEQTWSRDGQNWQMVQQRLTKGPPFPLIKTRSPLKKPSVSKQSSAAPELSCSVRIFERASNAKRQTKALLKST